MPALAMGFSVVSSKTNTVCEHTNPVKNTKDNPEINFFMLCIFLLTPFLNAKIKP
jgi:hypothetical protein